MFDESQSNCFGLGCDIKKQLQPEAAAKGGENRESKVEKLLLLFPEAGIGSTSLTTGRNISITQERSDEVN